MRAVVQRVTGASVTVDGRIVGEIGLGLLVLLGVGPADGEPEVRWLTNKLVHLRIFGDDQGKMNRSLLDVEGGALVVSQFTLYGDARKGNRPGFTGAARPELAEPLYERFCERLGAERGVFGAHMEVELVNDGPVTLLVEL